MGWKQLCESYAASYRKLGELEGKMLLPIVCSVGLATKGTAAMASELCESIEHVYPPAICYKIYMSSIDKIKEGSTKINLMKRLAKCIADYGLVKCEIKKFKIKCKPYASAVDFAKAFLKMYY